LLYWKIYRKGGKGQICGERPEVGDEGISVFPLLGIFIFSQWRIFDWAIYHVEDFLTPWRCSNPLQGSSELSNILLGLFRILHSSLGHFRNQQSSSKQIITLQSTQRLFRTF